MLSLLVDIFNGRVQSPFLISSLRAALLADWKCYFSVTAKVVFFPAVIIWIKFHSMVCAFDYQLSELEGDSSWNIFQCFIKRGISFENMFVLVTFIRCFDVKNVVIDVFVCEHSESAAMLAEKRSSSQSWFMNKNMIFTFVLTESFFSALEEAVRAKYIENEIFAYRRAWKSGFSSFGARGNMKCSSKQCVTQELKFNPMKIGAPTWPAFAFWLHWAQMCINTCLEPLYNMQSN